MHKKQYVAEVGNSAGLMCEMKMVNVVTQSAVIPLTLMKGVLLKELYLLSLPIIKIYNYDIK